MNEALSPALEGVAISASAARRLNAILKGEEGAAPERGRRRKAREPSSWYCPPSMALTLRSLLGVHILGCRDS